jgi:hypothetical protein
MNMKIIAPAILVAGLAIFGSAVYSAMPQLPIHHVI